MNPDTAPVRKQNKRREKEVVILQAAEKIFAEEGFGGATMQLIADAADLPKANVHYYFSTKEELYRQVVSNIFDVWLQAAGSFEVADGPAEGIGAYIEAKMEISRTRPAGSKVWASEVMHGAPIIQDYLETTLVEWTDSRIKAIDAWIEAGLMDPISPRHLLYMIWATTQHYADFGHQIKTLNRNAALSDAEWQVAKASVKQIILKGIGVTI
ncbi:TetR/AcrR family transcriptional regulator [Neptunicoccus sediminis]|uniref:TetR/AcrR family transcriptional regulator n=1 Tax=Neptunicoccus sediminis TaxID=1892596 RepID=UPI000845CC1A|nr:TetR/AcrR family transcriptional regulator [Neptunicoccus sediminis]